ncbi:MAG: hypothetical protein FWF51_12065 [Chitinivibrionia bacterium]|nr:hypothetical protein [Chitinivibrionia bacterium]
MITKIKMFAVVGIVIAFLAMGFKIYDEGKIAGDLRGQIAVLKIKNELLQKESRELKAQIDDGQKQLNNCKKQYNDCADDLKKEKARNVRKEARAGK